MIYRQPPALALWLLRHFGPRYHHESLEGDLFEQYQRTASRSWYWQQTLIALMLAGADWARARLLRIVATSSLRLFTEVAALLGAAALTQTLRFQHACASQRLWDPALLITIAAAIALVMSCGFYLSLCVGRIRGGKRGSRQAPTRQMLVAFLVTALSAGTLTWATTADVARCGQQPCSCQSPQASPTAPQTSALSPIR